MPRKKFKETPYDPISADLAREVAATGRGEAQPQGKGNSALKLEEPSKALRSQPRNWQPHTTKRVVITRKEDDDFNAFLLRVQAQAETKVAFSVLVRSAVAVLLHSEKQILGEIGDRFPQAYPSTQDSLGQGEFEERWIHCLTKALRRLPRPVSVEPGARQH